MWTLLFTETLILHLLCLWQYERNNPQNQDTLSNLWKMYVSTALMAQSAHKQQKYKINLSVYNAWDILIWISCHDWQGTYAWGTRLEFSSMAVNLGRKVANQTLTKEVHGIIDRFPRFLWCLETTWSVYLPVHAVYTSTGSMGSLLW